MEINSISTTSTSSYAVSGIGKPRAGSEVKPSGKGSSGELTDEQKSQIAELKARDAQVRAHEQAHMAAGGQYVRGGASFSYQTGPDGKRYAIGGEVSIDASPGSTPQETIRKMEQVKRAAMAPADPSGQDAAVAAKASQAENKARTEQNSQQSSGSGSQIANKQPLSKTGGYSPDKKSFPLRLIHEQTFSAIG